MAPDRKKSPIRRGSATKQQRETMINDIKDYFTRGLSANYCHTKTGYAKETVYSYFNEWTEELIDRTDFIKQQQSAKVRLVASLDNIIDTYDEQRKFLLSKRTTKFNAALENSIANVNHLLAKVHIDKTNVLMIPTLDVTLRNLIKDRWGIDIELVNQNPHEESRKDV